MDLKRAKALLEHYAESREGAEVGFYGVLEGVAVGVILTIKIVSNEWSLWTNGQTIGVSYPLGSSYSPEEVAKIGGCLIQLSNLMRQLKALED